MSCIRTNTYTLERAFALVQFRVLEVRGSQKPQKGKGAVSGRPMTATYMDTV